MPRTRFAPVKTTDDLLVLRSDVYEVGEDMEVRPVPGRADNLPFVELDKRFYRLIDECLVAITPAMREGSGLVEFERRFPDGPPSLREAERLVVHGDVTFGANVRVHGAVELDVDEATEIASGSLLEPTS